MPNVIRGASPADLIALVPALTNMHPRNSVVLIAFAGKLTHAALRFDLPAADSPLVIKRVVTTMVGTFCKIPGADGVVPVVCTDGEFGSHAAFVKVLERRLDQSGFQVRDALCHASSGWGSYLDTDVPPGGHPLAEIADAAARHPELMPVTEAPLPDCDELSRQRMRKQLAGLRGRMAALRARTDELDGLAGLNDVDLDALDDPWELGDLAPLADLPLLAEEALDWDAPAIDTRGALLLLAVQGPPARDLIMLQWASELAFGDAMFAPDSCMGLEAARTYTDVDKAASDIMIGRGPKPDAARLRRGIAVLRALVARADDADRPAPLCMLAWLSWALGRGSLAGHYIEMARAIDPAYSMAELLDTMMSNGMMPEWVFER